MNDDGNVVDRIQEELAKIEERHRIRILLAVESGSRSWGFESPGSDYDVRFVYAHPLDWYLSIQQRPDTIRLPFDGCLDIAGWDLRKSLRLFRGMNPSFIEWLTAPLVYSQFGSFADKARDLARRHYSKKAGASHYLNMAEDNFKTFIQDRQRVNLKKYFYVLRPLVNILWMMVKDDLIPMSFAETLEAVSVSAETRQTIRDLLGRKMAVSELGEGDRIPMIDCFIDQTIKAASDYCAAAPASTLDVNRLDHILQDTLREAWPEIPSSESDS
jgi:predicted nucleotidyltransferase